MESPVVPVGLELVQLVVGSGELVSSPSLEPVGPDELEGGGSLAAVSLAARSVRCPADGLAHERPPIESAAIHRARRMVCATARHRSRKPAPTPRRREISSPRSARASSSTKLASVDGSLGAPTSAARRPSFACGSEPSGTPIISSRCDAGSVPIAMRKRVGAGGRYRDTQQGGRPQPPRVSRYPTGWRPQPPRVSRYPTGWRPQPPRVSRYPTGWRPQPPRVSRYPTGTGPGP
jgi:hypothetical protein